MQHSEIWVKMWQKPSFHQHAPSRDSRIFWSSPAHFVADLRENPAQTPQFFSRSDASRCHAGSDFRSCRLELCTKQGKIDRFEVKIFQNRWCLAYICEETRVFWPKSAMLWRFDQLHYRVHICCPARRSPSPACFPRLRGTMPQVLEILVKALN